MRVHFGHCIGCDQPIRPPYLSAAVHHVTGNGDYITEWETVDVCGLCAGKLTASDLHRLVSAEEEDTDTTVMVTLAQVAAGCAEFQLRCGDMLPENVADCEAAAIAIYGAMVRAASAIEARRVETEGLDAKHESAVPVGQTPTRSGHDQTP